MDVIINQPDLYRILHATQGIADKSTTMSILINVLLTAENGALTVLGTDLEITAQAKSQAEILAEGAIAVNARILTEIVKELPNAPVRLTLGENQRIDITCQNTAIQAVGVSPDGFPVPQGLDVKVDGAMPAKVLSDMINKTIYATSMDETRFNLNGVCFSSFKTDAGENALRLVATDGHRLAFVTRATPKFQFETATEHGVIVPRKGLLELKKVLDSCGDTEIGITITEDFFAVEMPQVKMAMRLVDGVFPDYRNALPMQKGDIVQVDAKKLEEALRRVILVVSEKSKCVRLDITGSLLRISSSSPELGTAKDEVPVEYPGQDISIGFNARYMLDMISVLGGPTINIALHGALGPGKIWNGSDESAVSILMPMRLPEEDLQKAV